MSFKLYAPQGYAKGNFIRVAADIAEIPYTNVYVEKEQTESAEFKQKNPLGKVPVIEIENTSIFETNSILRYVARLNPRYNLYGNGILDSSLVDQWLDFCSDELSPTVFCFNSTIYGYIPFDKTRHDQAKQDLFLSLKALNNHLSLRTFLVGNQLTIADIAVAGTLNTMYKFILDPKARKEFQNVFLALYYTNIANIPQFQKYFGQPIFREKEWDFNNPAGGDVNKQSSQPAEPKANEPKTQQQLKEEKQQKKQAQKELAQKDKEAKKDQKKEETPKK